MNDNSSAYNACVYDENIVNTLPYYREYSVQIMDVLRATGRKNISWLDTGCGTGTLAENALKIRDDISFTLCDPSQKMLDIAMEKLEGRNVRFICASSQELDIENEFDIVTAVQCHHYLSPQERETAVGKCFRALKKGGIFVTFENIRLSADESDAIGIKRWTQFMGDHGMTPEQIEHHTSRRFREVFPITVDEHLKLLAKCGFATADILWASYMQAGFWAIK